jgi:hypothetical protein
MSLIKMNKIALRKEGFYDSQVLEGKIFIKNTMEMSCCWIPGREAMAETNWLSAGSKMTQDYPKTLWH